MIAQIFILPSVDSIAGFTLLFLVVSFVAGWIVSSGPRLSYFGVQFAYAFYLINLSEFTIQTSLTLGRDRVIGILLGLSIMWIVFDQLWGASAVSETKKAFVFLLRGLAKLAREQLSQNLQVAIEQTYALRETVNSGFNKVRALADGVLFEFGPTRQQDLTFRRQVIGWQPELRLLFISCIVLLKYRLQLPGFALPESVRLAQQEFEDCLARALDGLADRFEGKPADSTEDLQTAFARLMETQQNSALAVPGGILAQQMNSFSALSERIMGLALSLDRSIQSQKTYA
jgi:multidrug resistance protein MdtO